jgi:hypothetical protein
MISLNALTQHHMTSLTSQRLSDHIRHFHNANTYKMQQILSIILTYAVMLDPPF